MAHYHVEKARGKAKDQLCVDCGEQAHDWSRIRGTNDEKDPSTFEPRCRKCHMAYDDHKRNQRGKPAHPNTIAAGIAANTGNKYNLGRERPDLVARNLGNHYARPCPPGCSCGKHNRKAAV